MPFFTSEWSLKFQHVPPSMPRSKKSCDITMASHFWNHPVKQQQQPARISTRMISWKSWILILRSEDIVQLDHWSNVQIIFTIKIHHCTSKKPRCVECVDSQRVKNRKEKHRKVILTTNSLRFAAMQRAHVLLPLKIHATRQELIKLNQKIVWDARSECRSFETWGSHSHHIFLAYF